MAVLPAGCWESSSRGGKGVVFKVLVLQHPLTVPLGGGGGRMPVPGREHTGDAHAAGCTSRFGRGFETCLRWMVVLPG